MVVNDSLCVDNVGIVTRDKRMEGYPLHHKGGRDKGLSGDGMTKRTMGDTLQIRTDYPQDTTMLKCPMVIGSGVTIPS